MCSPKHPHPGWHGSCSHWLCKAKVSSSLLFWQVSSLFTWRGGKKRNQDNLKNHNKNTLNTESIAFEWEGPGLESVL